MGRAAMWARDYREKSSTNTSGGVYCSFDHRRGLQAFKTIVPLCGFEPLLNAGAHCCQMASLRVQGGAVTRTRASLADTSAAPSVWPKFSQVIRSQHVAGTFTAPFCVGGPNNHYDHSLLQDTIRRFEASAGTSRPPADARHGIGGGAGGAGGEGSS